MLSESEREREIEGVYPCSKFTAKSSFSWVIRALFFGFLLGNFGLHAA